MPIRRKETMPLRTKIAVNGFAANEEKCRSMKKEEENACGNKNSLYIWRQIKNSRNRMCYIYNMVYI